MSLFKFEIVQTVEGSPDPLSYPEGLSHTPKLSGSAKVVIEEFEDETTARKQAVSNEDGCNSDVWQKHCPPMFRSNNSVDGLDIYYIGPLSEEESKELDNAMTRVLYHHKRTTPAIVEFITGKTFETPPPAPTENDLNRFYMEIDEIVDSYFDAFNSVCEEILGD